MLSADVREAFKSHLPAHATRTTRFPVPALCSVVPGQGERYSGAITPAVRFQQRLHVLSRLDPASGRAPLATKTTDAVPRRQITMRSRTRGGLERLDFPRSPHLYWSRTLSHYPGGDRAPR